MITAVWEHHSVASFLPFRGMRYQSDLPLHEVVCPPYDVIDEQQRAELVARHQANAVRIELPDISAADPYVAARNQLDNWVANGTLILDAEPAFYRYALTFSDGDIERTTVGIIGALGVGQSGPTGIQPHEMTTPKARSDREDQLRALELNTSPIWGLVPAEGFTAAAHGATALAEFTDAAGVHHSLAAISDPSSIATITKLVDATPVVIADGHHRYETASKYFEANPNRAGADAILCFMVELSPEQLHLAAIHRLISGADAAVAVRSALQTSCDVIDIATPTNLADLATLGSNDEGIVVHSSSGTYVAVPSTEALSGLEIPSDTALLAKLIATLPNIDVAYEHDLGRAEDLLQAHKADVVVVPRVVPTELVIEVASKGLRFPPKSTFFWPKPLTGLVFRPLA